MSQVRPSDAETSRTTQSVLILEKRLDKAHTDYMALEERAQATQAEILHLKVDFCRTFGTLLTIFILGGESLDVY